MCPFFHFLGELTANTPSAAKKGSAAVTLAPPAAATTGSQTAGQPVTAQSSSHSKTTPQQVTTPSNTTTQESVRSSKMRNQPNNTAQPGRNPVSTTLQWSRTGKRGGLCSDWFCGVQDPFDSFKWKYLSSWAFFVLEESGKGFKGWKRQSNVSMEGGVSVVWGRAGGERQD